MEHPLFLLIYAALLGLPGLAIWALLKQTEFKLLASISISYIVFVLAFGIANNFSVSSKHFSAFLTLILVASAIELWRKRDRLSFDIETATPVLSLCVLSGIYQYFIGAFVEVPSDIYAHMERYQDAARWVSRDTLGFAHAWKDILFQRTGVFYYLLALSNGSTALDARQLIELVDFANRTLFLLAIYSFSQYIFQHNSQANKIAAVTVILVFLHMGISVFAFARYYTLAPTMLAMIVYFFAIAVFLKQFNRPLSIGQSVWRYGLISAATLTAAIVHVQEALFIGVMVACISGVYVLRHLARRTRRQSLTQSFDAPYSYQPLLICVLALCAFVSLYVYSHLNLPRADNVNWRLWEFGEGFGLLPKITVLNLKYEFYSVVTPWGLLVYGLFFLNFKRYRNNLFLLAGMLSPVLTFLNPFFVDAFMRHYNSTTVWRLTYLLPLHFVAADLMLHYAKQIRTAIGFKKAINALGLIGLVFLVLPFQGNTTRIATLFKSDTVLSHQYYSDLLDYLNTLETRESVLTDPMTGYMVSGLTHHTSIRRKFFRSPGYKHFSFYDYSDRPLDKYPDHLLIVNQRDKSKSEVGELSGHWRPIEWVQTANYYPDALIEHIAENPHFFELLWENAGVSVYRLGKR